MVGVSVESQMNPKLRKWLEAAASVDSVSVGYPEELSYPDGTKVSEVARIQEFGTGRVPPRPFVRPAISSHGGHWFRKVREAYLFAKDKGSLEDRFADLGAAIRVNLQQAIDNVTDPPLSETTVERRKARGNGSVKPLVDSGLMRNAIRYRVGDGDWI